MKRYLKYKFSGFDWMGDIPEHWVLTKNRYGFIKTSNGVNQSNDTPVLSLTIKGVKVKTDLNFGKSTESYIGHQLVKEGDIVFTPRDFDQTPILSDVSKYNGCISNLYIVDRTKSDVLNEFVNYYWYGLKYSVNYFKNFSHGMRYSFNRFQFDEIPLLLPPYSEQLKIVNYLHEKITEIDNLIQVTQRIIQLLREKRTSLINETITRGLNNNVRTKNSGVEWIGEIPEHWDVIPLKFLGDFQNGISKSSEYFGTGFPFMNYGDIYNNEVTPTNVEGRVQSTESDRTNYSVERGDIFFTRTSESTDDIGISSTCLQTIPDCVFSGFVIRFRFYKQTHIPEYSRSHFQTHWKKVFIESKMNIVTRSSLSQQVLGQVPVLIPPIEEQKQIVDFLEIRMKEINHLISIEERRIKTLKEYQQGLISEIVTGKIKVIDETNSDIKPNLTLQEN